jgi:hypothetical protein
MFGRAMYVWKLKDVLSAEGGVDNFIDKAKRARLSSVWIKVADGSAAYSNVSGDMAPTMTKIIESAHASGLEIWGWQVPHCPNNDAQSPQNNAKTFGAVAQNFKLDGLIMDAEGGADYFQGDVAQASAYAKAMRAVADNLGKPLGISSNDIPTGMSDWSAQFFEIAKVADFNFPQTYYGASRSVADRLNKAASSNASVRAPFIPVGAGFLGTSEGGCASASECGARAREFIRLCNAEQYQGYSFWHWGGAPLALWDALNSTPV